MKTERDLFLYELDGRGFSFNDKSHTEFGFNDEVLNMVYEMWCASASREGYKLVPVEPTKEMLNHIVATDRNNCIGIGNNLPWHIPIDLRYFKKMTIGCNVYFGSKTFDSLPKIDWGSRNPVRLSRNIGLNNLSGWICGGGEIYKETLKMVDTLYITEVDTVCNGDVFYPEFKHLFKMQYASEWMNQNSYKFRFTIWRKNDH